MTRRLFGVVLLVGCMMLALPGVAMAKLPRPKITGLKRVYIVKKGASLTIGGQIKGNASTKRWNRHVPLEVEKLVKGRWVDLIGAFEPRANGKFKVTMRKPGRGSYRVCFDGCEHYAFGATGFYIRSGNVNKRGPVVKLNPELSVSQPWLENAGFDARKLATVSQVPTMPLAAAIHTGLSAEAMNGNRLTLTALARISGETSYTVVWTSSAPVGFSGSADITVSPIVVPEQDQFGHWYEFFKVRAEWLGNDYTNPGSAESVDFDWGT